MPQPKARQMRAVDGRHLALPTLDQPLHPDWALFDLDPSEPAGFEECRALAKLLKVALDRLELRSYVKTTGQRGLQIYVPIIRRHRYGVVREWVHAVGQLIGRVRP